MKCDRCKKEMFAFEARKVTYKSCDRCKKEMSTWRMSWFNHQNICLDCVEEERKHPEFEAAKKVILEHEALGEMNYVGVGLPKDLEEKYNQEVLL